MKTTIAPPNATLPTSLLLGLDPSARIHRLDTLLRGIDPSDPNAFWKLKLLNWFTGSDGDDFEQELERVSGLLSVPGNLLVIPTAKFRKPALPDWASPLLRTEIPNPPVLDLNAPQSKLVWYHPHQRDTLYTDPTGYKILQRLVGSYTLVADVQSDKTETYEVSPNDLIMTGGFHTLDTLAWLEANWGSLPEGFLQWVSRCNLIAWGSLVRSNEVAKGVYVPSLQNGKLHWIPLCNEFHHNCKALVSPPVQ